LLAAWVKYSVIWVVRAKYPAAALQGVLVQGAGLLRLAQLDQAWVRAAAVDKVMTWFGPSTRRARCKVPWPRVRAGSGSPSQKRARVRMLAAANVSDGRGRASAASGQAAVRRRPG
jgi:hypothetical protein